MGENNWMDFLSGENNWRMCVDDRYLRKFLKIVSRKMIRRNFKETYGKKMSKRVLGVRFKKVIKKCYREKLLEKYFEESF